MSASQRTREEDLQERVRWLEREVQVLRAQRDCMQPVYDWFVQEMAAGESQPNALPNEPVNAKEKKKKKERKREASQPPAASNDSDVRHVEEDLNHSGKRVASKSKKERTRKGEEGWLVVSSSSAHNVVVRANTVSESASFIGAVLRASFWRHTLLQSLTTQTTVRLRERYWRIWRVFSRERRVLRSVRSAHECVMGCARCRAHALSIENVGVALRQEMKLRSLQDSMLENYDEDARFNWFALHQLANAFRQLRVRTSELTRLHESLSSVVARTTNGAWKDVENRPPKIENLLLSSTSSRDDHNSPLPPPSNVPRTPLSDHNSLARACAASRLATGTTHPTKSPSAYNETVASALLSRSTFYEKDAMLGEADLQRRTHRSVAPVVTPRFSLNVADSEKTKKPCFEERPITLDIETISQQRRESRASFSDWATTPDTNYSQRVHSIDQFLFHPPAAQRHFEPGQLRRENRAATRTWTNGPETDVREDPSSGNSSSSTVPLSVTRAVYPRSRDSLVSHRWSDLFE